ncbi:MAG: hypothetical protein J6S44_03835 [Clostridia bacterium]|nr:hypothetical protein [Clostridia bacterium]MBO7171103.1 hypothetical protein [Clostridia bacterium]
MKPAIRKVILNSARAFFLSLLLCLLLTKSENGAPIAKQYHSWRCCVAIAAETNIFDLDDVTFAVHHGRPDNSEWTHMSYVPYIDLYFEANESNLFSANRVFLARAEGGYKNKKYWCDCRRRHLTEDASKWMTFTVPRELFTKDEGCFKFVINAPYASEMPSSTYYVMLHYEKMGHDQIKFTLEED